MHDAAHGVLMRTRGLNEWVSQWFCAYPVGADTISYRHYHLKHHRSTQQPDDPDLGLSAPFPITRASYRRKFIVTSPGRPASSSASSSSSAPGARRAQLRTAPRELLEQAGGVLTTNFILLAILTALGKPHYYLMFWLLPNMTWQMVITRIRNIAEHAVVPDNNDVFRNARTTYASWWVRALVAPYWVNYHVDHHLLFYVPCYNLQAARRCCSPRLRPAHGDPQELPRDTHSAMSKPQPQAGLTPRRSSDAYSRSAITPAGAEQDTKFVNSALCGLLVRVPIRQS